MRSRSLRILALAGVLALAPALALAHCGNSNRVGALLYAWLVLERGESPAKALEKAKAAGLSHPEMIEKVRKLVAERQAPPPRTPG
ncbi:MAG TPA: hypothetical protein VLB76_14250 [Thermoanaerobaculia bacterium]|jgi:hypothetical protein|nr:hypothetical protein [Thermoanaerobaculia bacterium]